MPAGNGFHRPNSVGGVTPAQGGVSRPLTNLLPRPGAAPPKLHARSFSFGEPASLVKRDFNPAANPEFIHFGYHGTTQVRGFSISPLDCDAYKLFDRSRE